jgi:hypothetical protein
MTEVTVTLPDDLASKAKAAGLLSSEGIERALREALRREAGRKLLEIGREMQTSDIPPMTDEEIQAEVDAVRAELRAKRNASGA